MAPTQILEILSNDHITYMTSTTTVQNFSQPEAPEQYEHASFKVDIAFGDTWDALPELFKT